MPWLGDGKWDELDASHQLQEWHISFKRKDSLRCTPAKSIPKAGLGDPRDNLANDISILCGHISMQWDQLDIWLLQHLPDVNVGITLASINLLYAVITYHCLGLRTEHDLDDLLRRFYN